MNILLTNDDGIFEPGIAALYKKLIELGSVTVVAPAMTQSGASHSITITKPLIPEKIDIEGRFTGYRIEGSPADCVKLAVMELLDEKPDLLVAGINHGANTGVNVFYSGTVAAAMEGAFLNIPAVAVSLAFEKEEKDMDFDSAAEYAVELIKKLMPIEPGYVININIPRLSKGKPKGIRVVPQSTCGYDEFYRRNEDENGNIFYQLGGSKHRKEEQPTDTSSIVEGYVTITALAADMTDRIHTEELKNKNFVLDI